MSLTSLMKYPNRGEWGQATYRGNCSGYVIKDLIEHFYPNSKPKQFVEVFSGGGTGKDVAISLGIENSIHLDLNNGWNALQDELPISSDFTFSHPPYWDIIKYEEMRKAYSEYDLSNFMSYEEFIQKLDSVNEKIYQNLLNGGRHAILVGDVRKKEQYYSIIKDMTWFGELESHIIKEQFNTVSGKKTYQNASFIPIEHEHLLIFKRIDCWNVGIKYTKDFSRDIRMLKHITWRELIRTAIEHLNGAASIDELFDLLNEAEKANQNNNVRAKIRQTLNQCQEFKKDNQTWQLTF